MCADDDDLLTTSDAAHVLDCSENAVRRAANLGRLPVQRTSSGIRVYRRRDLDAFRTARDQAESIVGARRAVE